MKHKTLEIDNDTLYFNQYDRPLYHTCQHIDFVHVSYPNYGIDKYPCGGSALYLISYFSNSAGTTITKHVCERHLNSYIQMANEKDYKIIDKRT